MHLIVGLGNPGDQYTRTRHNFGFMVVDYLAQRCRKRFQPGTGHFEYCQVNSAGHDVCLLKPMTYMNRSGEAVTEAIDQWHVDESNILVVYDDFNLSFGTLRLRAKGSDGGHNGMASIIYHLQSEKFSRLRIGIHGESFTGDKAADFVLSPFAREEEEYLLEIIKVSADAVESVVHYGLTKTMDSYNRKLFNG